MANPLLLDGGGRKFDMRCWVLLDSEYNIHLYRQVRASVRVRARRARVRV